MIYLLTHETSIFFSTQERKVLLGGLIFLYELITCDLKFLPMFLAVCVSPTAGAHRLQLQFVRYTKHRRDRASDPLFYPFKIAL